MKRVIAALTVTLGLLPVAFANDYYRSNHRHYHNYNRGDWVSPAFGGVLIGIAVARASEPPQAPVIVERAPVPINPSSVYRLPPGYQTIPCLIPYIDPVTGHRRHEYVLCIR